MFQLLASTYHRYALYDVPACWAPLCDYLGHSVVSIKPRTIASMEYESVNWLEMYRSAYDPRHILEIACACRPELVDALFRVDTEWPKPICRAPGAPKHEFVITTGSGFYRPEIMQWRNRIMNYTAKGTYCVLTPCSARKPYPSDLHLKVNQMLPNNEWEQIVTSTVLGLAPEPMWHKMPRYDAGLPNPTRLFEYVAEFFSCHNYRHVVVYADFNAYEIVGGLKAAGQAHTSVLGSHHRDNYENLLSHANLGRLRCTIQRGDAKGFEEMLEDGQEDDSD